MIEVRRLVKRYGRITAVDDLSFSVARGSVLALLGPNGAGKSTTIKAVTGQLRPTSGSVAVAGHDLQKAPLAAKRAFGYIPDRPYLYPNLSGRELLRFLGRLREVDDAERRASAWLDRFELLEAADELIDTYSHGMRQRLTFCSALLHAPEVLIVDEPMVGLDPRGARDVRLLLREQADQGGAVLLTTHSMEVAEAVADEIVLMARGRDVARGTMQELRGRVGDEGANLEAIFIQLTSEERSAAGEHAALAAQPSSKHS